MIMFGKVWIFLLAHLDHLSIVVVSSVRICLAVLLIGRWTLKIRSTGTVLDDD